MKTNIAILTLSYCMAMPVLADKPEWAGNKGKPSAEQIDEHRDAMRNKHTDKDDYKEKKDKHSDREYKKDRDRNHDSENERSEVGEKELEKVREIEEASRRWWHIFRGE